MKQFFNKSISIAVILSFSFSMISCSSNSNQLGTPAQTTSATTTVAPSPTPVPACPEQVLIVQGDIVFGQISEDYYLVNCEHVDTVDLEYNIQPRDVNIAVEEWSSSDESIATVSSSGKVTPVGYGECEIVLHVSDGLSDGATTSINVTVQDGIVHLDDIGLPSYEELKANFEAVYGSGFFLVDSTHYFNVNNLDVLPFIGCYSTDDDSYRDMNYEAMIDGMNCKFIVCKTDDYYIVLDETGITIQNDDYLLFIYPWYGSLEDALEIAESAGIHIPTDIVAVDQLI